MIAVVQGDANDLPSIMPVMATAFDKRFGESWTESQCLGVVSMPGSHLMIAREGPVVGFALSRVVIDECELMLLAVTPQVQRGGIGRILLDAVIAGARKAKVASIFLEVRESNPAIALYTSTGFIEIGRRRGYYRGAFAESFDACTFRLTLT